MSSLTYKESCEGCVGDQLTRRRKLRMVHVVGDVGGEEPVVGAVLEQVPQGHCRMRESMHEDGLEQSFHVVN